MKKLLLVILLCPLFTLSHAAFSTSSIVGVPAQETTLANDFEINTNAIAAFEKASYKKPNFFERLSLKHFQKKLQKAREYNGDNDTEGFNVWGFLLGLFLGPIGLLASFLSKDRNFRSWAWWGFRAFIAIATIVVLTL
jgi:hypothetical protein